MLSLLVTAAILLHAKGDEVPRLKNVTELARIEKDENMEDKKIMALEYREDELMADKKTAEEEAEAAVRTSDVRAQRLAELEEKHAEAEFQKAEAGIHEEEKKKEALLGAEAKLAAAEAETEEVELSQQLTGERGIKPLVELVNATALESFAASELHEEEDQVEGNEHAAIVPIEKRRFHFMSMLMLVMGVVFVLKVHMQRREALQEKLLNACGISVGGSEANDFSGYRMLA
eukprot:TRINITY_DN109133_c0_g1_i1.p1 TRINITY_DN109133_c0_g1~~TRINITY_DN109133_c0_g1_i1.p1  ORF type:complete len:246 (+),score=85.24 TRINITY_DN109133_c0_g1_i1:44-739(+)